MRQDIAYSTNCKLIEYLDIIHGDLKPQNVLVFEDGQGAYVAKVIDFGYSTLFHGERDEVIMPKSVPWSAPEHHHRHFTPKCAKGMDVYSFGMLCLWFLFGSRSLWNTPTHFGTPTAGLQGFSFEAQNWSSKADLLLSFKKDKLAHWAVQMVAKATGLSIVVRDRINRFFECTLCFDPQARVTNWDQLLSCLVHDR